VLHGSPQTVQYLTSHYTVTSQSDPQVCTALKPLLSLFLSRFQLLLVSDASSLIFTLFLSVSEATDACAVFVLYLQRKGKGLCAFTFDYFVLFLTFPDKGAATQYIFVSEIHFSTCLSVCACCCTPQFLPLDVTAHR